jgi:gliding motility-associated lipoprotein GldD
MSKFKLINLILLIITVAILGALGVIIFKKEDYMPKPYGYNRIILPEHSYQVISDTLPYGFEVSKRAHVRPSSSPYAEKYWLDIYYPDFDAIIQLTYKPVRNNKQLLRSYLQDAYLLTSKHQIRADAIDEYMVYTPQGDTAMVAYLSGQVPTQCQFYVTDSTNHFLRGALYFHTASQNDSLAPVIDFIKEDIMHMLYTLTWKSARP